MVESRVTVLMPTFNRPALVVEAVASVLAQTYPAWSLWVLNDGGQSVEAEIRRAAGDDPRVRYFDRPHLGKAGQLNWACEQLETPFVAYLDDDDLWLPDHLDRLLGALDTDERSDAAYSDVLEVRLAPDGQRKRQWIDSRPGIKVSDLLVRNLVNHNTLVHRTRLLKATGPYDDRLTVLIDWDIVRRMAWRTQLTHIAAVTVEHRLRLDGDDRIDSRHLTGQAVHRKRAYRRSYWRVFFKPPWSRA